MTLTITIIMCAIYFGLSATPEMLSQKANQTAPVNHYNPRAYGFPAYSTVPRGCPYGHTQRQSVRTST